MIVEITGPSGAGKTTILRSFIEKLSEEGIKTGAIHSQKLNQCNDIPAFFSDLDSHNIRTDIAALPWFLLFAVAHPAFIFFALQKILNMDEPLKEKVAILRSLLRKAGIYRFLSRRKFNDIVIGVDEGLFHSAHNFLMTSRNLASKQSIQRFLSLVPVPDALALVTRTPEILAERLRDRGDLSNRIRCDDEIDPFVRNAWKLFEAIANAPQIEPILVIIDKNNQHKVSNLILEVLHNRKPIV